MHVPYNDLQLQHASIASDIENAVKEAIDSLQYVGKEGNPFVTGFEEAFAAFVEASFCIGCANGTDALEIALRALQIGPGDEVIVPAQTWISTAEAVNLVGATPVFADIQPETLCMDPLALESACSPKTKAIIPVHLFGLPADMEAIMDIARDRDLKVIEDCAQAHGARYKGRPVGSFGDLATYSFYPGKNLGALGDAGALTTNSEPLASASRSLRDHGRTTGSDHDRIGRNSRLDAIQAAVLETKLKRLPDWIEERQRLGALYRERFANSSVALQSAPDDRTHVYHIFSAQTDERDSLRAHLETNGIQTGVHYPIAPPFTQVYRNSPSASGEYPHAMSQMNRSLSLPIFPGMTEEQLDFVADCILEYLE